MAAEVEKWGLFEAEFPGPKDGNPFVDVTLDVDFALGARSVPAPGFYDGDGVYRVRFMPDTAGRMDLSNAIESQGARRAERSVSLRAGARRQSRPGPGAQPLPLRLRRRQALLSLRNDLLRLDPPTARHAARDAGDDAKLRFQQAAHGGVSEALHLQRERAASRRVPARDAEANSISTGQTSWPSATSRPRSQRCGEMGVEADIIVFHPYDRWGYCAMAPEQDDRYVRYLVARLGAFRNVWWSLANEYDFLIDVKPVARWDRFFHIIEENDPARHLKSIHNGEETMNFDHRKPWVDHVCIQNWNVKRTADWRREWGKPIVNDELEYEGDISLAWGNLTPQELTHRFWITVTRGGYAGHGECYAHPQDLLWWAKGGVLRGESWKRVAFLRSIIEADVVEGLTPAPTDQLPWPRVSCASEGDYRLIYFGEHQPALWAAGLPNDDREYDVDVIDAWNMTIEPAKRVPCPVYPRLRQRGAH